MTTVTEQLAQGERALVPMNDEHLIVDEHALAPLGSLPVTIQHCDRALKRINAIIGAGRFWRGDLLNLAGTLFGEEASQIIDAESLDEKEAAAERFVAEHVKPSTRAYAPSWEHARVVAKLADEVQVEWLERARSEGWSAGKLRTELAKEGKAKTFLQWFCVVDCGTEAKRDKLAEKLEGEGFTVLKRDKVKKQPKPKKAKKAKGEVTAKRRTPKKMNQARRPPR
jgi:hypothetical protein